MRISQLAAQLYTVRDHTTTPADMAAALRKVKHIGYPAVELAGLPNLAEQEFASMLDGEGLSCCASHEGASRLLDEPQRVAESLHALRCPFAVCPSPGGVKLDSADDVYAFAHRLDAAGSTLREAGITLAYHNHSIEFRRYDGRLMLDILLDETDPNHLQIELDTYWAQYGGGDPEDWCRSLRGRLPLLHLKDYAMTPQHRPTFAEVGRGNLKWRSIIEAAEHSGCQWFIVEQDTCPGDPFASLQTSLEYIRDHLCL